MKNVTASANRARLDIALKYTLKAVAYCFLETDNLVDLIVQSALRDTIASPLFRGSNLTLYVDLPRRTVHPHVKRVQCKVKTV